MKKIIAIILAMLTLLSVVSCGGNNGKTDVTTQGESSAEESTTEEQTTVEEEVNIEYEMATVGTTITDQILKRYPNNGHPRLIMTTERIEEIKAHLGKSDTIGNAANAVVTKANDYLGWTPQDYNIYDGIRLLEICRNYQNVIKYLGMAYLITGKTNYAEKACQCLDKAASFPDWNPYHFLDVGEMCVCFALGYDWFYNYLSAERKTLYAEKMMDYGIDQAMRDYLGKLSKRTYKWYKDTPGDNWKLVCNGGIGLACMAIFDDVSEADKKTCISALNYGYKSNYDFIRAAYDENDGSYVESLTYWEYATEFLGYYATGLDTAIGTTLDLLDWVGLRKTGTFVVMLSSNQNRSFAFGDSSINFMLCPSFLWIGHMLDLPQVGYLRYEYINRKSKYSMQDLIWLWPEDTYEEVTLDEDYGAVGATNASFRSGWNKDDVFVAVHFGKNAVPHGHSDMGEFIYEYQHLRFFCELGADDYNLNGYSVCYRHISEGHNTLTINPKATLTYGGQKGEAESYISKYKSSDTESFAICDMTSAYTVESAVRGIKLLKDSKTFIVQDEIKCAATDDVWWFAHVNAVSIKISADKKSATIYDNGTTIIATLVGDGEFQLTYAKSSEWSPVVEGQATNDRMRLAVNCKGKTSYNIVVAVTPKGTDAPTEVIPLSDWN